MLSLWPLHRPLFSLSITRPQPSSPLLISLTRERIRRSRPALWLLWLLTTKIWPCLIILVLSLTAESGSFGYHWFFLYKLCNIFEFICMELTNSSVEVWSIIAGRIKTERVGDWSISSRLIWLFTFAVFSFL